MKKLIITIFCISVLFNINVQAQINFCDTTYQIYITNQTSTEATVTLNSVNSDEVYFYTYFDTQGGCLGGTSTLQTPENTCVFGQSILDTTILWLSVANSVLGTSCFVVDTLIFNNSSWYLLNSSYTCIDSSLIDSMAFCIMIFDPVCGCDGITYSNDCIAENFAGVTSWTQGPCGTSNPTTSICEMFETYQHGDPIAETSSNWNSWGELMSGLTAPFIDDVPVDSTFSYSGSNSLYLFSGPTQGNQDIILPFGAGAPYELGIFEFSSMFYVNSGTGAYFNFQAENTPGVTWALDIKMDLGVFIAENTGSGINYLTNTYPENQWFELKIVCDLTNNNWEIFIDNNSLGTFTNTVNKVASLDLYPIVGHQFYVDDVCWSHTPPSLEDLNAQVVNVAPITGLTGQNRAPSVEVRNLGINNINSFEVDFLYNGTTVTETVTGLNLATSDVYTVEFDVLTNFITLQGGTIIGTATVTNVNGLGQDDNPSDDSMNIQVNAITPATGKLVVGEEATGTWCGWCPRGAVALNWMDHEYEGYWQGIAVHNGDPMTDFDYDNGLAGVTNGYPSGVVDRGADIDPSNFKQDFLQRITQTPNALITNGAKTTGNLLEVNLTVDFQNPVTGQYRLACILVEDSVTGTAAGYFQSNSYSGGGAGSLIDVDGTDWANKPSNVPATQMIYRHVARGIAPTFNGTLLSSTSYLSGDSEKRCFQFTLDPSWDVSKIHIVGMLIDPTGSVDNASSNTIADAEINGWTSCSITSTALDLNGPDRINIYPNPSSNEIQISNLYEENIKLSVLDINGKLVLQERVSNKEIIDISALSKGVYQINFEGKEKKETRKLIKD